MIDKIVNSQRIKYAVLDELFTKCSEMEFITKSECVNIYIDMHSLISNLYRKQNIDTEITLNDDNVIELTMSILNYAAHYRQYAFKYLGKDNRVFFIYNTKIPEFNSKNIPYGHIFFDKYSSANEDYPISNMIYTKTIKILKELIKGFKWIYLVESNRIEDTATIKYLATLYDKTDVNLIITKNDLLYQMVNDINNKFIIFRPSFNDSAIITKENLISYYFNDVQFKPEFMTSEIITIFQTILGIRSRNIDSINIRGKVKLAKIFDTMLGKGLIRNSVNIQQFINIFMRLNETDDSDFYDTLYNRFMAIDYLMSFNALGEHDKINIRSGLKDLYHEVSIEKLNDDLRIKDKINVFALNKASHKKKGLL